MAEDFDQGLLRCELISVIRRMLEGRVSRRDAESWASARFREVSDGAMDLDDDDPLAEALEILAMANSPDVVGDWKPGDPFSGFVYPDSQFQEIVAGLEAGA
ncbi:hypothetical protein [Nocardioides sp.]|uniref:hypothetical protein n=1 Tax=Nocardioides sp. TaxID=35761 RepID=UPI00261559AA|nr:hypothetical protein [Nocardioides sp.]